MECIKITKGEYEQLLKYRDIVNHMEEEVHEELNVKPLKDKRAIAKLRQLDKETGEGKRKTISDEELGARYKSLANE